MDIISSGRYFSFVGVHSKRTFRLRWGGAWIKLDYYMAQGSADEANRRGGDNIFICRNMLRPIIKNIRHEK